MSKDKNPKQPISNQAALSDAGQHSTNEWLAKHKKTLSQHYDDQELQELVSCIQKMLEVSTEDKITASELLPMAIPPLHLLLLLYPEVVEYYRTIKQKGLGQGASTSSNKQRNSLAADAINKLVDAYENLSHVLDQPYVCQDLLLLMTHFSFDEQESSAGVSLRECHEDLELIPKTIDYWRSIYDRQERYYQIVKAPPK